MFNIFKPNLVKVLELELPANSNETASKGYTYSESATYGDNAMTYIKCINKDTYKFIYYKHDAELMEVYINGKLQESICNRTKVFTSLYWKHREYLRESSQYSGGTHMVGP